MKALVRYFLQEKPLPLILKKLYKLTISLKLAVFTLFLLALITAIGTFMESRFNQETADKLVYQSWWMNGTMILLALNLTAVLIDRWPWKKHHFPFILAHVGILTTLLGAFMTKYFGVDASIRIQEGEVAHRIVLPSEEITLYSSFDGLKFTRLFQEDVNFFLHRPSVKDLYTIKTGGEVFTINDYIPFGIPRQDYKPTTKGGAPAIRFYLEGQMGRFSEWIDLLQEAQTETKNLGPAQITLTKDFSYSPLSEKELVFYVKGNKLFYSLKKKKNPIQPGETFPTGWMDFRLRLIEFFPKARKFFVFSKQKQPTEKTLPAVQVSFEKEKAWIGRNSYVQFYKEDRVYALGYLNKRKELGFSLRLLDFKKTNYQGSEKAKTYESQVETPKGKVTISMNEPLKFMGYTFYQSGFEEEKEGEPSVSILSVNRDPGRPLKYGGAAAVIIGIILLFYRKKRLIN